MRVPRLYIAPKRHQPNPSTFGAVARQPLEGDGCCGVATPQRGVELPHTIPLLSDELGVDGLIGATREVRQGTIIALDVDAVDALPVHTSDARTEATTQHRKRGEVDFGVAVGVSVVLLKLEFALVVEQAIERKRRIAIRAL